MLGMGCVGCRAVCFRAMVVAASLVCVLMPTSATGQTPTASERLSLQAAAGLSVIDEGHVLSAGVGYSPLSWLELLVIAERIHLPFQLERFPGGSSVTRGGTLTFVSGELRLALRPPDRVSPFALAGVGGGVSRPNVNAHFPDPVRNDLRVVYVGGGLRVPLRQGLSVLGDVRGLLAMEGNDGILAMLPVRVGVAWRF